VGSLRLGLFGGTFDPPHVGHLLVAQEVSEQLSLDRVLFVVSGRPPHKLGEVVTAPHIRAEMTNGAVEGNPNFEVSEVEFRRAGPTYTVDTLRLFRSIHPDSELFFILGADQLAEFHEWNEPEEILRLATLVAVARDGVVPDGLGVDCVPLTIPRLDISSSEIRTRIRAGRSARYLVPDATRRIIETHCLYRAIS
jgi:nicotinate-nucleotide adenylyltransferase